MEELSILAQCFLSLCQCDGETKCEENNSYRGPRALASLTHLPPHYGSTQSNYILLSWNTSKHSTTDLLQLMKSV